MLVKAMVVLLVMVVEMVVKIRNLKVYGILVKHLVVVEGQQTFEFLMIM